MPNVRRLLCVGLLVTCLCLAVESDASAQYPVVVQPAVPAVVGYTAERRGLLGLRVVYRPVVAPVAAAPAVPTVTVARPVVAAPVTLGYAPVETPVTSYYAPAPVAVPVTSYYAPPVTTYRVPVTSYRIPVFGF